MTDLEKLLAPKAQKQVKSGKVWIGFSANGTGSKELLAEFAKYGIHDRAEYVKALVRADLARRRKGKVMAEEPAEVTA